MFDWLTGPQPDQPALGSIQDHDAATDLDPETPAHLFAVRAFKTALFGTPEPPKTLRRTNGVDNIFNATATTVESDVPPRPDVQQKVQHTVSTIPKSLHNRLASPSKSILVTPGNGNTRRKTVSFTRRTLGEDQLDFRDEKNDDQPGLDREAAHATNEPIRRTLFATELEMKPSSAARANVDKTEAEIMRPQSQEREQHPNSTTVADTRTDSRSIDDNTTIDLESPRSRSGKHWKGQYQREHAQSKEEMRQLIRYSQLAKLFAEQCETDSSQVAGKLRDAERKTALLEGEVSRLANDLFLRKDQSESHEELLNELAAQTAQALRYKRKADRYRTALELQTQHAGARAKEQQRDAVRELKAASQLQQLERAAQRAEEQAEALQSENAVLKDAMLRVKDEMKRYGTRAREKEERRRREDSVRSHEVRRLEADLRTLQLQMKASQHQDSRVASSRRSKTYESETLGLKERASDVINRPEYPRLHRKHMTKSSIKSVQARKHDNPSTALQTRDSLQHGRSRDSLKAHLGETEFNSRTSARPLSPHRKSIDKVQETALDPVVAVTSTIQATTSKTLDPATLDIVPQYTDFQMPKTLSADRAAAARRRLEEKAARRRGSPSHVENNRPIR